MSTGIYSIGVSGLAAAQLALLERFQAEGLPFELGGTSPVERSGDEVASHIAG